MPTLQTAEDLLGHFLLLRADIYSATKFYRHAVVDLHNGLLLYPENPTMKRNLVGNLKMQAVDREYKESPQLSARPRMPAWKALAD